MWKILTNDLYLYLLIHQHEIKKINYVKLSKEVGKTRQTLSKYYNALLEEEVISEDSNGFIIVNDLFNLDNEDIELIKEKIFIYSSNYIAYLICRRRFPFKTDESICTNLGISKHALLNYKRDVAISEIGNNYIYAIVQNKIIKYVGSTEHLEERIRQHCQKRAFLKDKDFIILERCNKINRFDRESFYRQLFKPEWNDII